MSSLEQMMLDKQLEKAKEKALLNFRQTFINECRKGFDKSFDELLVKYKKECHRDTWPFYLFSASFIILALILKITLP